MIYPPFTSDPDVQRPVSKQNVQEQSESSQISPLQDETPIPLSYAPAKTPFEEKIL